MGAAHIGGLLLVFRSSSPSELLTVPNLRTVTSACALSGFGCCGRGTICISCGRGSRRRAGLCAGRRARRRANSNVDSRSVLNDGFILLKQCPGNACAAIRLNGVVRANDIPSPTQQPVARDRGAAGEEAGDIAESAMIGQVVQRPK